MRVGIGVRVGAATVAVAAAVAEMLVARHRPARAPAPAQPDALPAWFGDASRPAVRIAGRVFGVDHPVNVHLLLDVPDVGIWRGPTARTTATGAFTFEGMRPGPYVVFAEGGGALSRLAHVDTLRDPGARVEVFAYARAVVMREVRQRYGNFRARDWAVPTRYVEDRSIARWLWEDESLSGTVLEHDGTPARGVGVQPVSCEPGDNDVAEGIPALGGTTASGRFTVSPVFWQTCGLRIWMGPRIHEVQIDPLATEPIVVHLPVAGAEAHHVFSSRRDRGDPHGAWIRGRVVRDGRGVADVDVAACVMPLGCLGRPDAARSRSDGTFEVYVSSRFLDESRDVALGARRFIGDLRGRQVVQVSPGGTRDGVRIEVGPGLRVPTFTARP